MIRRYIQDDNNSIRFDTVWSPPRLTKPALNHPVVTIFLYLIWSFLGLIKSLTIKKRTDVIYSMTPFLPDFIPSLIMKIRYKDAIWLTAHSMFAPNPFKGGFSGGLKKLPTLRDLLFYCNEKLIYPFIRVYADLFYETNELDMERCISEGVSSEKVFVIRGGVDTHLPSTVPEANEKKYNAVFIGRLHPQKGCLELIDIWKLVCEKKKDAKLAIIGNGPLEKDMRGKIKEYNISENIDMYGFLDGTEKIKIFKESSIILHPALYDSGGMAACEAMICGLPGVSFDLPALKVYYPKGMLKTPCYDFKSFAENVLTLLNDKELYEKSKKDALEWAKEWDWDKVAREVSEKIESKFPHD